MYAFFRWWLGLRLAGFIGCRGDHRHGISGMGSKSSETTMASHPASHEDYATVFARLYPEFRTT